MVAFCNQSGYLRGERGESTGLAPELFCMRDAHRSGCPINLALEVLGDRWSLLILRDMIFGGARRFREFLGRRSGSPPTSWPTG